MVTGDEPSVEIRDDQEEGAYVVEVDGLQVGKAVYHLRGGRHFFVHTEVDNEFSGMGLGQRLIRFALDDVRSQAGRVVPICPFFADYIDHHLEYEAIVDKGSWLGSTGHGTISHTSSESPEAPATNSVASSSFSARRACS